MLRSKSILFVLVILAAMMAGVAMLLQNHRETTHAWFKIAPTEDNELFEKVLENRRNGDFDDAVTTALKGVKGKPSDDFLFQTIADTYFERAQKEPVKREQWVNLAVQYSERALVVNPGDIVNVFNVGESYLTAGMNRPKPSGCGYYRKSLETFERLEVDPILGGKSGTIEGERVSTGPYRKKLEEKIAQVRQLTAGCPASAEKP